MCGQARKSFLWAVRRYHSTLSGTFVRVCCIHPWTSASSGCRRADWLIYGLPLNLPISILGVHPCLPLCLGPQSAALLILTSMSPAATHSMSSVRSQLPLPYLTSTWKSCKCVAHSCLWPHFLCLWRCFDRRDKCA